MILLGLACTGALPDDSTPKDTGTEAPPACGSILGSETAGDYTDCYVVGSTGFYNIVGSAIEGCDLCSFSLFLYLEPGGVASCADGDADLSVNDEAYAEFADGGTAGYAGLGSDGPLGSCAVTTASWTADDDNSHAWSGTIAGEIVLIDTYGDEVGLRTVEISADIVDPE